MRGEWSVVGALSVEAVKIRWFLVLCCASNAWPGPRQHHATIGRINAARTARPSAFSPPSNTVYYCLLLVSTTTQ